jgi:hypothetical protein
MVVGKMAGARRRASGEWLAKKLANDSKQLRNPAGFARRNKAELASCTQFWSANFLADELVFDQTHATSCDLARQRARSRSD